MSKINLAFVVLVLLSTYPAAAIAPANERPLVDAGLDQRVRKGSVVLLDGTGSRDPDGAIEKYEWSIETPSGSVRSPADPNAARTRFRPTEIGRYAVTLTATDDDGATSSDTLYVTVSPGRAPSVDLSGPRSREAGESGRYTARIDAGDASLDYVVWTIDGVPVANRTLTGERESDRLTRIFPTDGTRRIRATVYDVDGQRDSASLSVSVERPSPPSGSSGTGDIAGSADPTIRGPRLVTGARPLTGAYSLRVSGASDRIDSVSWRTRSGTVGRSSRTTVDWSPGRHRLFALVTYDDGSTDIARFPDGGTEVRADPKPAVEIGALDRFGGISGTPVATDGYGNLRTLRVFVDGNVVGGPPAGLIRRQQGDGRRRQQPFDYADAEFGRERRVVVVATDMRGQTTTETTFVKPLGKPEIVRSEFVNGPVDSYHRRIDASRYAAHHVLEIDLKGIDPEAVAMEVTATSPSHTRQLTDHSTIGRTYHPESDSLVLHTYWAGNYRYDHAVNAHWELNRPLNGRYWGDTQRSTFQVEPSDPELRYEVIHDGTIDQKTEWGIIVDASRSFDPDHTNLKYRWKGGANPISKDDATAKFDSWHRANLEITDGNNGMTTNHYNFLNFYNPGISEVTSTGKKTYKPNETVRFEISTNRYKLTKNPYDLQLGLDVENADYDLIKWDVTKVGEDCEIGGCGLDSVPIDIDQRRFSFFRGTIEIKASELTDDSADPKIVLFNKGNPDRTRVTEELPEVKVLVKGNRFWENVSVSDIEYTIEKPIIRSTETIDKETRDEYLKNGYSIERTDATTRYTLEKRVQTQKRKYETRTQSFRRPQMRTIFLESHPEWSLGDQYSTTSTWTTTETEWRNSKSGAGTFTGRTRRQKTDSADYRIKKRFEYDYQVEKTGTRTVWRTKRIRVRKTGTRTVTKCYRHFGCYPTTETYSYWDTETYRISSTETYTYTVTETEDYWAYGRFDRDHRFTGGTRRVRIDDADYTTQYEYSHQVEHHQTVQHYDVSRQVKTQKAKYEWVVQDHTVDLNAAKTMTRWRDDWRIGDTQSIPKWTLTKRVGTKRRIVSSYGNANYVIETRATISGDVKQRYIDPETGSAVIEPVGSRQKAFASNCAMTKREVKNHFATAAALDPLMDSDPKVTC